MINETFKNAFQTLVFEILFTIPAIKLRETMIQLFSYSWKEIKRRTKKKHNKFMEMILLNWFDERNFNIM